MTYTLDEIITSISGKPLRAGLVEVPSDTVAPDQYLRSLFGPVEIRSALTQVPVTSLRILQGTLEMWRYVRLCSLSADQFHQLMNHQPLDVVRGRMIEGYPLILGNHRALYALLHGIAELPATVHFIVDEEIASRFQSACQIQYQHLDMLHGRHDAIALREEYKEALGNLTDLKDYIRKSGARDGMFRVKSARYRHLEEENNRISERIPCISLSGYIKTLKQIFKIPAASLLLSEEPLLYQYLTMTQGSIEKQKLHRIAENPELLNAPILVARTRLIDYVIAGHTRLRARMEKNLPQTNAILLHLDNDQLNGFLDAQAVQSGYLAGKDGIRRLALI